MRWSSHKDHARKALAKLAGPHLPGTLKQVEKAIAKAHAEHETATRRQERSRGTPAGAGGEPEAGAVAPAGPGQEDDTEVVEYLGDLPAIAGDLGDVAGVVGPDGAVYSDADPGL